MSRVLYALLTFPCEHIGATWRIRALREKFTTHHFPFRFSPLKLNLTLFLILIEISKILKGYENIDQEVFFDMSQSSLRGHSLKLNKKRVRLDVAKLSFSNRVVNELNILDEEIISGCSLAGFERKLDRHLRDKREYISFSFLPLYRQLHDLDSLTHQVQVPTLTLLTLTLLTLLNPTI